MTWTVSLGQADYKPGDLTANVSDEEAAEIRDAILSIIARPVFERAEQAQKMRAAMESTPTPRLPKRKPAKGPKYHRVASAKAANRSDLLNIIARVESKGAPAMDLKALTASVNARRHERGDLPVTASSVRDALAALEGDKLEAVPEPRGKAANRRVWRMLQHTETCVEAGIGVRS